jgi:hypothetical protein
MDPMVLLSRVVAMMRKRKTTRNRTRRRRIAILTYILLS